MSKWRRLFPNTWTNTQEFGINQRIYMSLTPCRRSATGRCPNEDSFKSNQWFETCRLLCSGYSEGEEIVFVRNKPNCLTNGRERARRRTPYPTWSAMLIHILRLNNNPARIGLIEARPS